MADSMESVSSDTRNNALEASRSLQPMEGFGNTYYVSSLNYGSVEDGALYQPTLEQKLKKQYWKTKQAMIQKLGKSQDEFVVAGDAEIDTKLEKAYHLETSCGEVLDALEQYSTHVRALSSNELNMGGYLCAYSEEEPTQASSVMKAVGTVQEKVAKHRMSVMPSLQRLYNEFVSFMGNALTDLDQSIQRLEKARTDYRAALLWMRDVSAKLQNPDHRDELVKFRQVQAQVKDTKKVFERLKYDLAEKIDMVAASRCNLISCSLPYYQKELLAFLDQSAQEYHSVLETLRTYNRDQHQYQETKLVEEIRDLELGEPIAPEAQSPVHSSEQSHRPAQQGNKGPEDDDDEMLIDVGSAQTHDALAQPVTGGDAGKTKDAQVASNAVSELKDLLNMDEELLQMGMFGGGMESFLGTAPGGEPPGGEAARDARDNLEDEWGNFSSFMQDSTEGDKEASAVSSDWEKEFTDGGGSHAHITADQLLMSLEPGRAQPPPSTSAQSTFGGDGVPVRPDTVVTSPGGSKPRATVESESPSTSAPPITTSQVQLAPPTTTSHVPPAQTLLAVDVLTPAAEVSPPGALQELLGIDLSTAGSSTLPPPLVPMAAVPSQSVVPQSTAPTGLTPMGMAPVGTFPLVMTPVATPPMGTTGLLNMSTSTGVWSLGSPRPVGHLPPPSLGSLYAARPTGTAGALQPMGIGMGGAFRPMGMAGSVQPLGPAPLLGTGALPLQPAPMVTKPSLPTTAAGPKQKEPKGNTTAWMNVFAHLDPLVNEKA